MNQRPTWARTGDRRTWCASTGQTAMFVTHLVTGGWRASVEDASSPELPTRLAAQHWAENHAAGEK